MKIAKVCKTCQFKDKITFEDAGDIHHSIIIKCSAENCPHTIEQPTNNPEY